MIFLYRLYQCFVILVSLVCLVPTFGYIVVPMLDTLTWVEDDIKELRRRRERANILRR